MDPLFPELAEDLSAISDEDLAALLKEHEVAAELIDAEDEDFIKGMSADDVLVAYETGVEQIEAIRAEQDNRVQAQEEYLAKKSALAERRKVEAAADENPGDEDDSGDGDGEEAEAETLEIVAEVEETEEVEEEVGEKVLVTASGKTEAKPEPKKPALRRPPSPSAERRLQNAAAGAVLVAAAGLQEVRGGEVLDRMDYARAVQLVARRWGPQTKSTHGIEEKRRIAGVTFDFPEERRLTPKDWESNAEKIRAVVPDYIPGIYGKHTGQALVASGGLCAPLEPIYSMPNFAVLDEPVWDSLPIFQADRGGVNVPAATSIGDITSAISSISEANDALGGTFATKSCQDLVCPAFTEVAVQILAHCREYGNLNGRAWPEKIAHENDLTMAALARTSEGFMLDRIKALSINVTQAAIGAQYGSYASLVHAIVKASAGIRFRLRMSANSKFRVLLPAWILDHLAADTAATQFDRFQGQAELGAHLNQYNVVASYYLDDVVGGTSQGFAAEAAGALDEFPDDVQYAIFPEGQFIGVDSGVLELGIVRDSTLNSTNDFQIFGERFRNLAMLGPSQGALWITQDICPTGSFPAAATALAC